MAPAPASARWVVDPREQAQALPPVGRSGFDHLLARMAPDGSVPFPFEALLAAIERGSGPQALARVLIPRGRSLQREAAAPAYFAFPRAVAAVTGEHPDLKLADRLFLGYHETAGVLEVISYNEPAGRFEFQVVRDYRRGAHPRVAYANRELCTACHQNGGPIFARPLWDETNASPDIARLLGAERAAFYGVPARPDVDSAYALDNATDRANMLAAYQLLWSAGCGAEASGRRCRADLLQHALVRRLSDGLAGAPPPRVARIGSAWRQSFPLGLLLPTADIPNRLPLRDDARPTQPTPRLPAPALRSPEARAQLAALVRASDVPSSVEPLLPRDPLETWTARDLSGPLVERVAVGLGTFLTDEDARRLDARLAEGVGRAVLVRADCTVTTSAAARVSFACAGASADGFALTGRASLVGGRGASGSIDSISFGGVQETAALSARVVETGTDGPRRRLTLALRAAGSGRSARRADGRRLDRMVLWWQARQGTTAEAELSVVDDVDALLRAVDALVADGPDDARGALAEAPFRRGRVMDAMERALGLPQQVRCCEDASRLPAYAVDGGDAAPVDAHDPLGTMRRYCGRCHDTPDRFPPNFLHGPDAPARVARCADRIAFRLGMWALPPAERAKTPMPPPAALQALHLPSESWPAHPDLAALRQTAATAAGGAGFLDISGREYASLPPCLAEAP
jgi:hypothetical protein